MAEAPTPQPGPGQVLIKLTAAGMNPMDRTLAGGEWRPLPATFPMVLGADGAGVVDTVGEGTAQFSAGDNLCGQPLVAPLGSAGTYAEYVAVTEGAPLALVLGAPGPSGGGGVADGGDDRALYCGGCARVPGRQGVVDRRGRRWDRVVRYSVRRERRRVRHRQCA